MDLITIEVDNYKPHPQNPNGHPDAQLDALGDSLGLFGQYKNVVVWNDYYLAGHGLVDAARRKGLKTLDAVDLSHLSDEQALALMVADNRLPELAVMGDEALAEILQGMTAPEDIPGVDQAFIDELLAGITPPGAGDDAEPQIDRAAELAEEYGVEVGQLWQLGEHRLICGDCTDETVVKRVMGGETADITFTSPPYNLGENISISNRSAVLKDSGTAYNGGEDSLKSEDYLKLLIDFTNVALTVSDYAIVNLQQLSGNKIPFIEYLHTFIDNFADVAIWHKTNQQPAMAKNVMNSTFEYLLFLASEKFPSRAIKTANFRGTVENFYQSTIAVNKFCDIHGATFPLEFAEHWIKHFSINIIYEPFLGSGTTLIACENLGRRCRAIELDPGYVAVAIRRWEELTGGKAEVISDIQ